MKHLLSSIFPVLLTLCFGLAAELPAQQPAGEEGHGRFVTVDIFVDSGSTPLAAYQLEFRATNGSVRIVGIEGGDSAAFRNSPVYDPKAMQGERAILASFRTDAASTLPSGITRVATVHLHVAGEITPGFAIKLHVAGDAQGRKIPAEVSFAERKKHETVPIR